MLTLRNLMTFFLMTIGLSVHAELD
ncbi:uncharacterized protein METZ01_LOCUS293588, partial [marine metagenome]